MEAHLNSQALAEFVHALPQGAIAGMAVDDENFFDAVASQTVADFVGHRCKGIRLQGQGSGEFHPVLGNTYIHGSGNQDLRIEFQSRLVGDVQGAGGVVFHGQVFIVLLGTAGGQDGTFDLARFERFAHVPAGQFPQPYFSRFQLDLLFLGVGGGCFGMYHAEKKRPWQVNLS